MTVAAKLPQADCSVAELHRYLRYDAETGRLYWRASTNRRIRVGDEAFSALSRGYRHGKLLGRSYYAHRVIWAMHTGTWPGDMLVDHINCNPLDNRIVNLRLATKAQNIYNRGADKRNSSGLKGVTFDPKLGKWKARIRANRKTQHLGVFTSPEDAYAAYRQAAPQFHGEFARWE